MSARNTEAQEMQAAAFVARMDNGCWSQTDEAELQHWLAADYRNHGYLLQAQAIWLAIDTAQANAGVDKNKLASLVRLPGLGRRSFILGGGALAASVAAALLILDQGRTYSTDLGEIRRVPLADGSSAAINSASRLTVRLSDQRRDVQLTKGEAWFRVAKDAKRPFIVEAGSVLVRAVGTAFSVRRRAGGAEVIVSEGIVESWALGAEGHRVRLSAGQRAFIADNSAITVKNEKLADADRALAWREGFIDLAGTSVSDAVADFNRYNMRKLVLDNAALGSEQIEGIFRTDDPVGFAHAVGRIFDAEVDMSDPTVIRLKSSKK